MIRRLSVIVALGFAMLATVGCEAPTGRVTGKVSVDGKDVPIGTITFSPATGNEVNGPISNGSYVIEKAPPGEYKVSFTVPQPPPLASTGGPPGASKIDWSKKGGPPKDAGIPAGVSIDPSKAGQAMPTVKLPPQYTTKESTPLSITVVTGNQEKNFELK